MALYKAGERFHVCSVFFYTPCSILGKNLKIYSLEMSLTLWVGRIQWYGFCQSP